MSGRFPQRSLPPSRQLNGFSPALFRRQQLWTKMAVYRPLAVLAGIWVVLLAIALLAFGQLLHTDPDAREVATPAETPVYPHERLTDGGEGAEPSPGAAPQNRSVADGEKTADQPDLSASSSDKTDAGFNLLTLAALVGICALGSWVLSIRLKAPPKARRKKTKRQQALASPYLATSQNTRPSPVPSQPQRPIAPRKLAPYDPSQPLVKDGSQPPPVPKRAAQPQGQSPENTPSDVAVVAEDFQHRLDWPEDSLINTADVRQRRSLSSFL